MDHYDVIIIGTGAGGGTLAYHLAPSGKRILLLERGDYVRREKDNWEPRAVNVEARYQTKEVWRDADGKELHPHTNYNVGVIPSSSVQPFLGCARKTSVRSATAAGSRRRGRLPTKICSRITRRLSSFTTFTASEVRIPR